MNFRAPVGDLLTNFLSRVPLDPDSQGSSDDPWIPNCNIYEFPNQYVLLYDLAGMKKEEITVNTQNQLVTVSGNRVLITEDEGTCRRGEWKIGSFKRALMMPNNADTSKITASMENGILKFIIPCIEFNGGQTISIK
jgi:HSP20 family protein